MFKWSYSTNGLTSLSLVEAIEESEKAGYEGLELSFQFEQFDPFTMSKKELQGIKNIFEQKKIRPVAISSATTKLLSDVPHEPSLLSLDLKKRNQRISLIRRAVEIAKDLDVPIVSFQSGYLRQEHTDNPNIDPRDLLIESIRTCLKDVKDVTLVIEPEPGMFVETLEDASSLIDEIASPSFRLHVDIGHAYCTEANYAQAIKAFVPYTAYMHLADIKEGYNLKIKRLSNVKQLLMGLGMDLDYAGYLIYVDSDQSIVFIDKEKCIVFSKTIDEKTQNLYINWLTCLNLPIKFILMEPVLAQNLSGIDLELEIKAYVDSVAGIDLEILEKLKPIIRYLRKKEIQQVVCNTLKGKVHYHEIPGKGKIDFKAVLKGIIEAEYDGYITIELYNHVDVWKDVLGSSREYLINEMASGEKVMENVRLDVEKFGWKQAYLGEIDHRTVKPPYVRLIELKEGKQGDHVCFYDLRFAQPNVESIDTKILHTLEHCLIAGFRKYLPDHFISVGPMGCQTGFYLVLLNMLSAKEVISGLEKSLEDVLEFDGVPYHSIKDCGQMKHHNLVSAKEFSKKLLEKKAVWLHIESNLD